MLVIPTLLSLKPEDSRTDKVGLHVKIDGHDFTVGDHDGVDCGQAQVEIADNRISRVVRRQETFPIELEFVEGKTGRRITKLRRWEEKCSVYWNVFTLFSQKRMVFKIWENLINVLPLYSTLC